MYERVPMVEESLEISEAWKSLWNEYNLKSEWTLIVNVMLNSVIWVLFIYYYSILIFYLAFIYISLALILIVVYIWVILFCRFYLFIYYNDNLPVIFFIF